MEPTEISPRFKFTENGFTISEVPLKEITKKVRGPFYAYDKSIIEEQYLNLKNNLPQNVEIFYAMKANPHISIVKILNSFGAGVEVASYGELFVCEKLKINPNKIIFAGPGKTDEELDKAIRMGIASINVENSDDSGELERISKIATKLGKIANISLRINTYFKIKGAGVHMGGQSTQFGIDEKKIIQAVEKAKNLPGINLKGIHVYSASGIIEQKIFLKNLENTLNLAKKINSISRVNVIDIGGGLGVKYKDKKTEFSLIGLKSKTEKLIKKYSFIEDNQTRLIIEPGRYLVAKSGIYVSKIIEIKKSKGKNYFIVEGGINHMLRPALAGHQHQAHNLSKNSNEKIKADVARPLCTPMDILSLGEIFPADSCVGDYIGIFYAGAYGFTESMPWFLSHDTAAEILVYNGKAEIIRRSISAEKALNNQRIPEDLK